MRATSGSRTRGVVSAAQQGEWLARYEASGQSVRAFCAPQGLRPTTLTWWRRRRRERAEAAGASGALIEVTWPASRAVSRTPPPLSSSASATDAVAVLAWPAGLRLEFAPGSDPAWVASLLRALTR